MGEELISFLSDSIDFELDRKDAVRNWLIKAIANEGFQNGEIAYVFTSDESLLEINQKYLNHDTYTDIITFDYSEKQIISGEVYISIERVRDNALKYSVDSVKELHRVMIHGILHLCGYSDKDPDNKAIMTGREDYYLSLRTF